MGLVECLVELYIGNQLAQRQKIFAPVFFAISQCIEICQNVGNETQPIKVKFIKDDNEFIEFKNNPYLKWERGE